MDTSPASSSSPDPTSTVDAMFRKIISSPDAFFKSQQKDEPDLNETEKYSICSSLYSEHALQFLGRYFKYLDGDDIECFRHIRKSMENGNDAKYELEYYLDKMARRQPRTIQNNRKIAKNRRYSALKRLIAEGTYFSDYEMRQRDPLLYEQMIGQYQTENEQREAFHSGDRQTNSLSSALLDMYDTTELAKLRQEQMAEQTALDRLQNQRISNHSDQEEFEEEEDDDLDESAGTEQRRTISNEEKQILRNEFIREMQERFLDGKDANFDYKSVDDDPSYDPMELEARDEEDKYFDEEDPEEYDSEQNIGER